MTLVPTAIAGNTDVGSELLTDAEAAVLGALLINPGETATRISATARGSTSATMRALSFLVDVGLVVRVPHPPSVGMQIAATWGPADSLVAPDDVTSAMSGSGHSGTAREARGGLETASPQAAICPLAVAPQPDEMFTDVAAPPIGRLGTGGLRALVIEQLAGRPSEEFSPAELARILVRSSGAVANCLEKLVAIGQAEQTCAKPRRFRASPP